jgi:oxygen-independent coproporphyrinogen-3 oxidase
LPVETKEVLPLKEEMSETVILNLRMMEGIAKQDFINRFNVPIESIFGKQLSYLKENKLIESNDSHYFLTERGIFISNTVFVEFLN